ncbi:MAG: hypothetical protein AB2797_07175, partial [Candidatus Thiodiazotropha sp.]
MRKQPQPFGVRPEGSTLGVGLKMRRSALFVVHLESSNLSPCAPKEVPLGCAPKEVPLGCAPKEVPLGYAL